MDPAHPTSVRALAAGSSRAHLEDQAVEPPPIGELLFSACTFAEYLAMFDLAPADLHGLRVLDCPAGAASFTVGAAEAGAAAVAVDPVYVRSQDELLTYARAETERGNRYVLDNPELFVWSFFRSPADHLRARLGAVGRFGDDRRRVPERYLAGSLPELPFPDGAFDLAVSSHLLFTYDDRFDRDFHLAAARELARVATEVRLFPTLSMRQEASPFADDVAAALRADGFDVERREAAYRFQRGPHDMLLVRRA